MQPFVFTPLQLTSSQGMQALEDFLQGQITADVTTITAQPQLTAICDLKGRVQFGFWLVRQQDAFIVYSEASLAEALQTHLKKYGVFARLQVSVLAECYAQISRSVEGHVQLLFGETPDATAPQTMLAQGLWVITAQTSGLFQPQELRLHQLGGVSYTKGCYLGQEIVARLYFKAAPKAFLHYVSASGTAPALGEQHALGVVNVLAHDQGYDALVVAQPEMLVQLGLQINGLPEPLMQPVARPRHA